jgi:hypothetical protein
MLLELKKMKPLPFYTPTKWQTVILRNYGLVEIERLALVLKTDANTIKEEAKRLGLDKIKFCSKWKKTGYITITRNNWSLLPYEQLLELLDMDEKTLDYNLREDDFLNVKLGMFKPDVEPVYYYKLTKEQVEQTDRLAKIIKDNFIENYADYFCFYNDDKKEEIISKTTSDFEKIVYSYSMPYGDTFMEDDVVEEGLLKQLQDMGVNGLWMQGVLAKLSPYPFVKGLEDGYEKRRENLNKIIKKCKKYGIGVYLYFNEPRGIANDQLTEQTEKIKGRFFEERWSLCTTTEPVKEYLYNAVKDLVLAAPELAGIITITMSENMTNCHSRRNNTCKFCSHLKPQDVVPEVNNIMSRAVKDAGVKTKVLANLWGWTEGYGWSKEAVLEGIEKMDKDIEIMSVSEVGTIINKDRKERVGEYSLSKVGPSEETKENLSFAKKIGRRTLAKVQINNSWELAIVPFIPVFELVKEHMENLKNIGVNGLMMSWTLGGYPSVSLKLASEIFEGDFDYDKWLNENFSENAKVVKKAVKEFSDGFRYYPCNIVTLYKGSQHVGPTNLLYAENTEHSATMVCFPYDDVNVWRGSFSLDDFVANFNKLLEFWQKGLDLLKGVSGNENFEQLKRYAEVVFVNIKSVLVQIEFNEQRQGKNKDLILSLLEEERELTKRLYKLASSDAKIGYEASNHYFFTQNSFLEKLLNIDALEKLYK